ncbi:MAG: MDR family MFS transporter [Halobacteria archaeon]|nr:MDR family MFS transporter [Halobacteria archaeon]
MTGETEGEGEEVTVKERRTATAGVLLGIFLAGIEGTVVSTAMPTVVKSLGGLELYSWVFASYMLFAAVSMPVLGKLSDIYGRKRLFVAGVLVFVAGSGLSGLSRSMTQLILFRCLQGIGGGAMFSIPYTVFGVIYPPEKRGKAIGYGSAVWGVSSVVGPLLGYAIVTYLGWRWVFYLSIPVGFAAVALVSYGLEETTGEAESVDYPGAVSLVLGVGSLLLGLEFVGKETSVSVALLAVSAVSTVGFYFAERRAREPLLSLSLFSDGVFVTTNTVAFLTSFTVFAAIAYVPLFVQSMRGGAGSAALAVFPISLGWSGTSVLAGRLVSRVGERRLATFGTVVMTSGFAAASLWDVGTSLPTVMATVFVIGVGMGSVTVPLLTSIQNHLGKERMGLATSSQQFFRNLGGTVGVSVLGFVMTLTMHERLRSVPGVSGLGGIQRLLLGNGSPPDEVVPILTQSLVRVFTVSVVICVVAVVVARRLPVDSVRGESAESR